MFPDVPMFHVREGDVVVMRIVNDSGDVHPMHLHGHHVVVLSRDGVAASGSPWLVDSLDVHPGESYEIAFVADNPGIWSSAANCKHSWSVAGTGGPDSVPGSNLLNHWPHPTTHPRTVTNANARPKRISHPGKGRPHGVRPRPGGRDTSLERTSRWRRRPGPPAGVWRPERGSHSPVVGGLGEM